MATSILPQAKTAASCPKPRGRRRTSRPASAASLTSTDGSTLQAVTAGPAQPNAAALDVPLWGHLGLRLNGDEFTRWYPISQQQAGGLIAQLRCGSAWIAAETLNNRALLIQPAAVQRLVILDDDADEPEGDWRVSWSDVSGLGDAVYRGLWGCCLAGSVEGMSGTPELKAAVRGIVEAHGLDEQALHALLRVTHLHYRDGTATTLRLDAVASWDAFNAIEQDWELPALLHLPCWGEGMDFYTARDRVALLDMPLHLLRQVQAAEHGEFDRAADEWRASLAA